MAALIVKLKNKHRFYTFEPSFEFLFTFELDKYWNSEFPDVVKEALRREDFYFDNTLLTEPGSKINGEISAARAAMSDSDLKSLVRRFYSLQSERVEAYQLFQQGHEAYLRTGPHYDFEHYRQLVDEITKAFCGISKEVLEIKECLHHDYNRPDLSEHLDKLQIKEKHKLELTAKLQLAMQSAQDHPEDPSHQEKVQELKQDIIKNKESLSEIMQDFKYDSEDTE